MLIVIIVLLHSTSREWMCGGCFKSSSVAPSLIVVPEPLVPTMTNKIWITISSWLALSSNIIYLASKRESNRKHSTLSARTTGWSAWSSGSTASLRRKCSTRSRRGESRWGRISTLIVWISIGRRISSRRLSISRWFYVCRTWSLSRVIVSSGETGWCGGSRKVRCVTIICRDSTRTWIARCLNGCGWSRCWTIWWKSGRTNVRIGRCLARTRIVRRWYVWLFAWREIRLFLSGEWWLWCSWLTRWPLVRIICHWSRSCVGWWLTGRRRLKWSRSFQRSLGAIRW